MKRGNRLHYSGYASGKMIAERESTTLRYFHQDSFSSTSLMTDTSGNSLGTVKYFPFGDCLESQGNLGTDILFTGQRLDDTGLYYYGARYYDSNIGRFISPDTMVPDSTKPQAFNRYSYVLNNPLKYVDPTGLYWEWSDEWYMDVWYDDNYVPPAALTAEELREVANRGSFIPGEPPLPIEDRLSVVQKIENAIFGLIGGEITGFMTTALAVDVPVFEVQKDSFLAAILPSDTQSIYPFGVFTEDEMDLQVKAEEGFHWNEQKSFGPLVGIWYGSYVTDYVVSSVISGGNPGYSHDAIPAERRAMQYAAEQTHRSYLSPPTLPQMLNNWWNKLWHR